MPPAVSRALSIVLALAASQACANRSCEQDLAPGSADVAANLSVFDDYDPQSCTPDRQVWDQSMAPVIDEKCGSCHGVEPAFGAPDSLVDYDGLLAGDYGRRLVDRMARRAANHTMPPPSSAQLAHEELDLLVEWATCGEVHPDDSVGMEVDRPVYAASVPENLELPSFDVLADMQVQRDTLDLYQCFAMDMPLDEPRFIRRIQVVLDESRVLHHVVLAHDPDRSSAGKDRFDCIDGTGEGTQNLWAWAPGSGSFDFEEGGLEIVPGERLVIQIHYNNGAGLEGLTDQSGVRIFHGPTEGRRWQLADPGPTEFKVPEGDSATCGITDIDEPLKILAGMPHMHQLGVELQSWISRKGQPDEDLINLTGWNFEAQSYYRLDTEVQRGDKLHTRCGFRNDTGAPAWAGSATTDEMCFNFLFVSPL